MRVLYVVDSYPALSETYIRTELEFALEHGVEVAVWARHRAVASYASPPSVTTYVDCPLDDAVAQARPDVVHVHWLSLASKLSRALAGAGRPVTIRGHSFDFAPRVVEKLASHGAVRRVYLFPHLAAQPRPRRLLRGRGRLDVLPAVRSLPCTYASRRYLPPASGKDRTLVFRATAGLPTKDLSSFIRVAAACPGFRFVLAMTISPNFPRLRGQLLRQVERAKAPVEIRFNLQHEEVAELTGRAGICLRSHDPRAHVYGMPISVAEAMATGSYVVARDDPAARAFLGGAGAFFRRDEEAAALINATLRWSDADWDREAAAARDRAAAYRDDAVLPAVVHDWRSLVGESAA